MSLVYSPDGILLATGGGINNGTVRLWDVKTYQPVATLTGHTAPVQSVVFGPDGNRLASTSGSDATVRLRLWDTDTFDDMHALVERNCTVAGGSMDEAEWRQRVPERMDYRRTCP